MYQIFKRVDRFEKKVNCAKMSGLLNDHHSIFDKNIACTSFDYLLLALITIQEKDDKRPNEGFNFTSIKHVRLFQITKARFFQYPRSFPHLSLAKFLQKNLRFLILSSLYRRKKVSFLDMINLFVCLQQASKSGM